MIRATFAPIVALLLSSALLLPAGHARTLRANAALNRDSMTLEDEIVLTIEIESAQAERPTLPRIAGLTAVPRGRTQSMQTINGVMSAKTIFQFGLRASKPGTYRIPSFSIRAGQQRFDTDPLTFTVTDAESLTGTERALFIDAEVSNDSPYRYEQVIYTIRLFSRYQHVSCSEIQFEAFDEFFVHDLGDQRRYETTRGGTRFQVVEIRKALFPQEVGPRKIGAAQLDCEITLPSRTPSDDRSLFGHVFRDAGRTQRKRLSADALTLNVRTIPSAPENFSGLVGQFQLDNDLSTTKLDTGGSTTLRLRVRGAGNVQQLTAPSYTVPKSLRTYVEEPKIQIETRGDRLVGALEQTVAIVPTSAGRFSLPAPELTYFDPAAERFETLRGKALTIQVDPTPASTKPPQSSDSPPSASTQEPEAPQSKSKEQAPPRDSKANNGRWSWSIALAIAVALTLLSAALVLWRGRRSPNPRRARERRLRERLAALKQGASPEVVLRAFRAALVGDGRESATPEELRALIHHSPIAPELRARSARWLDYCEQSLYAGSAVPAPEDPERLPALLLGVRRT